jgi:Protein of unknown function (DUF1566)
MNIGETYGGGVIFYVDHVGLHGLIAGETDISIHSAANKPETLLSWYKAKSACDTWFVNGYNDWFLPNRNQLHQLYLNKDIICGLSDTNANYWSSSEYYVNIAWEQYFHNGHQSLNNKNNLNRVRPIRAF